MVHVDEQKHLVIYDPDTKDKIFCQKIRSRSISNRGEYITDFLNMWLNARKDHARVYADMFIEFEKTGKYEVFIDQFPHIISLMNQYLEETDFRSFVQFKEMTTKRGKTQILFSKDESCELARSSCFIKAIIPLISTINEMDQIYKKRLFSMAVKNLSDSGILTKVYNLVKSKVFGTTIGSSSMWTYLGYLKGVTPDIISLDILRSVLETILATWKYGSDPVTYIASFVKSAIEYIFSDVYTDSVIYANQMYTIEPNKNDYFDNMVAKATVQRLITKPVVAEFQSSAQKIHSDISTPSPIISTIGVPFVMSILDLKLKHFHNIGVQNQYMVGLYTSAVFEKFNKYPTLRKLLRCYVTRNSVDKDRIYSASKHCPELCNNLYAVTPSGFKHLVGGSNDEKEKLHIDKLCGSVFGVDYFDILSGQKITFNKKYATKELLEFYIELFTTRFEHYKITNSNENLISKDNKVAISNLLIGD